MGCFEELAKRKVESQLWQVNERIRETQQELRILEEVGAILLEDKRACTAHLGKLLDRAAALEKAQCRLFRHEYGLCIICKSPIAEEQLDAVPETKLCIECQGRTRRARPIAEAHPPQLICAVSAYGERQRYQR